LAGQYVVVFFPPMYRFLNPLYYQLMEENTTECTAVEATTAETVFATLRQIYERLLQDGNLDKILPLSLKFEEIDIHEYAKNDSSYSRSNF
jgi:hypothetical protein